MELNPCIVVGGQILIVFIGGPAFETTPINFGSWAVSVVLGALSLIVGALARMLPDGPLEKALLWLHIISPKDGLPSSRENDSKEGQLKQTRQWIHSIRAGRKQSNLITYFRRKLSMEPLADKPSLRGLLVVPSTIASKPA